MTIQEFFAKWNTRYNDVDGAYGFQCKDLFSQYNKDIVKAPYIYGNAIDLWNNKQVQKYYTQIPNTLTFVPSEGDVAIFDKTKGNPYGHVSICTGKGNIFWFESMDQNFPLGSPCHFVKHNYLSPKLLGVLRPKK